jgi:nucleoside-triphosphatase
MSTGIWIISGPSGCGKTSWCDDLAEGARAIGLDPQGVISPALFEAGRKVGIDIVDLASGERRPLAHARQPDCTGPHTDDWCFEPDSIEWANQVLRELESAPLLILDELGPLELTRGQGLAEGLGVIDRRTQGTTVVVIRPSYLEFARSRWPGSRLIDLIHDRPSVQVILGDIRASHS